VEVMGFQKSDGQREPKNQIDFLVQTGKAGPERENSIEKRERATQEHKKKIGEPENPKVEGGMGGAPSHTWGYLNVNPRGGKRSGGKGNQKKVGPGEWGKGLKKKGDGPQSKSRCGTRQGCGKMLRPGEKKDKKKGKSEPASQREN